MMKGVVTHNNRTFYIGQQFKHFKGKIYKIVAFCTNAETQEILVIYREYGLKMNELNEKIRKEFE